MKKLYDVTVEKTYRVFVFCEEQDAKQAAKDAVAFEPDDCSESTRVYRPRDVCSTTYVPREWLSAIPFGDQDGDDEKTVAELLAEAASPKEASEP